MSNKKFLVCEHCGNFVGVIKDSGVPMICCGQPMTVLNANTVDASVEKHTPVVSVDVQCQHFGHVCRFPGSQSQVLVEQFEGIGDGQEQTDGDGGHNHGQLYLEQGLHGRCAIDLSCFHQFRRNVLKTCHVNDHHVTDLLPSHQDDQTPVAGSCI